VAAKLLAGSTVRNTATTLAHKRKNNSPREAVQFGAGTTVANAHGMNSLPATPAQQGEARKAGHNYRIARTRHWHSCAMEKKRRGEIVPSTMSATNATEQSASPLMHAGILQSRISCSPAQIGSHRHGACKPWFGSRRCNSPHQPSWLHTVPCKRLCLPHSLIAC